jgi:hypothetical protein
MESLTSKDSKRKEIEQYGQFAKAPRIPLQANEHTGNAGTKPLNEVKADT